MIVPPSGLESKSLPTTIPKTHPKTPKKGGVWGGVHGPSEKVLDKFLPSQGVWRGSGEGFPEKNSGQILDLSRMFVQQKNSGRTLGGGVSRKKFYKNSVLLQNFCPGKKFWKGPWGGVSRKKIL